MSQISAKSGVPQGFNLGPLLFLSVINEMVDNIDVPYSLYADDMKPYYEIISLSN